VPTFEWQSRFTRDLQALDVAQQQAFRDSVKHFVADLTAGTFRKGLRVKRVQGTSDVWEMTWANDGRATFCYGSSKSHGEVHIIWRRVGTHSIFGDA
jgi:hypothetical protein